MIDWSNSRKSVMFIALMPLMVSTLASRPVYLAETRTEQLLRQQLAEQKASDEKRIASAEAARIQAIRDKVALEKALIDLKSAVVKPADAVTEASRKAGISAATAQVDAQATVSLLWQAMQTAEAASKAASVAAASSHTQIDRLGVQVLAYVFVTLGVAVIGFGSTVITLRSQQRALNQNHAWMLEDSAKSREESRISRGIAEETLVQAKKTEINTNHMVEELKRVAYDKGVRDGVQDQKDKEHV